MVKRGEIEQLRLVPQIVEAPGTGTGYGVGATVEGADGEDAQKTSGVFLPGQMRRPPAIQAIMQPAAGRVGQQA